MRYATFPVAHPIGPPAGWRLSPRFCNLFPGFLPVSSLLVFSPLLGAFMPIQAFRQSDFVGKAITIALIVLSIYVCGVIINKWMSLKGYKSYNLIFLRAYSGHAHPSYLYLDPRGLVSGSPIGSVYMAGMGELLARLHAHGVSDDVLRNWQPGQTLPVLSPSEIESIRGAAERSLAKQQLTLESFMSRISTTISCAPSLGLLGTVWGVMGAFMSMTAGGSSMISAVAPGISGALLTTVAGLVVAIPCTVFYNILAGIIRRHVVALSNFEDSFLDDIVHLHALPDTPQPSQPPQPFQTYNDATPATPVTSVTSVTPATSATL